MADDEYSFSEFEEEEDNYSNDDYENDNETAEEKEYFNHSHNGEDRSLKSNNNDNHTNEEVILPLLEIGDKILPPEVALARLSQEAKSYLCFKDLKINKIKCVALSKIVFGETHWRTAEAHLNLAETYLKGKIYSKQVLKHSNISRDILLNAQSKGNVVESIDLQYLLQNLYLTMGRGHMQQNNHKVGENCLQKAKLVSDKTNSLADKFRKTRIELLSELSSASSSLGKLGQSMEFIEEALELASKISSQYQYIAIKLHKQIANLEILNGEHANLNIASESAKKALDLSLEINGHDCTETAEILILKSRIETLKEDSDYNDVEENLREALDIFTAIEEPSKCLKVQKMHSKVLMQQERFTEAIRILDAAISTCEEIYGDSSTQCAELFELMGNVYFAQGKLSNALDYFVRTEQIYSEKKNCLKKQQNILRVIDLIRKSSKDGNTKTSQAKLKERPRFL